MLIQRQIPVVRPIVELKLQRRPIAEESCIRLQVRVASRGWMALVWPDNLDQRIVVATLTEHGGRYYFFTIREMQRLDQIADSPSIRSATDQ